MMATHTAGPWQAGDECISGTVAVWQGDAMVAAVGGRRISAEQSRIDARLIAAAPDLLALVIQYRDDLRRPPTITDNIQRRLAAIDAAIAKATGKQEG